MSDLLKEAIADAKAVRETALQNAKMALEEAFTPQLKSMLSAKLKEEEGVPYEEDESGDGLSDDEVDVDIADESDGEADEEAPVVDEPSATVGEDEESGVPGSQPETEYEEDAVGDGESEDEVPNDGEELNQEGMYSEDEDGGEPVEDEEEESNLDLEAIIKELEDEVGAEDEVEVEEESFDLDESDLEDEEEVTEVTEETDEDGEEVEESTESSTEVNEEAEEDEEEVEESNISKVEAELKEYKEAVSFLKNKLHEVNILNAKLLFTNKLFKEYALNNNQKLKVVETFDRAQTTREIKLVYSTLAEQFGDNGSIITKKSIKESASSAVGSTRPSKETKKVISEEVQVANRFKKLAGLI